MFPKDQTPLFVNQRLIADPHYSLPITNQYHCSQGPVTNHHCLLTNNLLLITTAPNVSWLIQIVFLPITKLLVLGKHNRDQSPLFVGQQLITDPHCSQCLMIDPHCFLQRSLITIVLDDEITDPHCFSPITKSTIIIIPKAQPINQSLVAGQQPITIVPNNHLYYSQMPNHWLITVPNNQSPVTTVPNDQRLITISF